MPRRPHGRPDANVEERREPGAQDELAVVIVDLPLHAIAAGVIAHRGPQLDHFAAGQLQLFELERQPRGPVGDAALLHGNDQRVRGQNDRVVAELIEHRHDQVDLHLPGNVAVDGLEQLPVERLAAVNGPQRLRRDRPAGRLNEPLRRAPLGCAPLLPADQPSGLLCCGHLPAVCARGLLVGLGQQLPPFLWGGGVGLLPLALSPPPGHGPVLARACAWVATETDSASATIRPRVRRAPEGWLAAAGAPGAMATISVFAGSWGAAMSPYCWACFVKAGGSCTTSGGGTVVSPSVGTSGKGNHAGRAIEQEGAEADQPSGTDHERTETQARLGRGIIHTTNSIHGRTPRPDCT